MTFTFGDAVVGMWLPLLVGSAIGILLYFLLARDVD